LICDGKNEAQVDGGRLLRSQDVEGTLVNFALGDVDEAFVLENQVATRQVAFGVCLAGTVNRLLRQSSHAEQFLPQFFHLLLKACTHYPNLPVT
jgi:hypothetical protein